MNNYTNFKPGDVFFRPSKVSPDNDAIYVVDSVNIAPLNTYDSSMNVILISAQSEDGIEGTLYIGVGLLNEVQILGNIYESQVPAGPNKCTCPIWELCNLGCRCGGI